MNVVALKPAPAEPRIARTLIAVSRQTRATLGIRLADIGLAVGEDEVILAMSDGKAVCEEQLSRKLSIRHLTVQRIVKQLVDHGYVEAAERPLFRLSQKGNASLDQIAALRIKMASDVEAMLGGEVVDKLTEYLETIEAGFANSMRSTI